MNATTIMSSSDSKLVVEDVSEMPFINPGNLKSESCFDELGCSPNLRPEWASVLKIGLRQRPHCLVARRDGNVVGALPLVEVRSPLFGKHLVSLPYINLAGVISREPEVAGSLIEKAVELADELRVRHLELRHQERVEHPKLTHEMTSKIRMVLELPGTVEEARKALKASVRNQIKKGEQQGFDVAWGGNGLLNDFYRIFARNMRDLGTPVFPKRLFSAILDSFGERAEICRVSLNGNPVSAAILVHGDGMTEVPSASALREFNKQNANMFMYWQLLKRSVERGQVSFDFGRTTEGSGPHRFKKQWKAKPIPCVWQYYVREGDPTAMRPDNSKFSRMIQLWKKLPVWLTRIVGPPIVRGIP